VKWIEIFSGLKWDRIDLLIRNIALLLLPFVGITFFTSFESGETSILEITGYVIYGISFVGIITLSWGYIYAVGCGSKECLHEKVRKVLSVFDVFPMVVVFSFLIGKRFLMGRGELEVEQLRSIVSLIEVKRDFIFFLFPFQCMFIYGGFVFVWGIIMVKFCRLRELIRRRLILFSYFFTLLIFMLLLFVMIFPSIIRSEEMNYIRYFVFFLFFLVNISGWGYLYKLTYKEEKEIMEREDEYRMLHLVAVWIIQSVSSILASIVFLTKEELVWRLVCQPGTPPEVIHIDDIYIFIIYLIVFFLFWLIIAFKWMWEIIPPSEFEKRIEYLKESPELKRKEIFLSFALNLVFLIAVYLWI